MNSTEKILDFLEQLNDRPDEELAAMFPVRPPMARALLAGASARVPDDYDQLDQWALMAAQWCLSMRSDDATAIQLVDVPDATVGQLAASEAPQ